MPTKTSNKLFNWLTERSAGVLLHPSSLPGNHGIGTLGREAETFIDFCSDAGLSHWQLCPLGPTGYGDSPYQCFSAFAGNPYLIDMDSLVDEELLTDTELAPLKALPLTRVDYGGLYNTKWAVLKLAYNRFKSEDRSHYGDNESFKEFKKAHASWLDSYAAFTALKANFNGAPWTNWDSNCRTYKKALKSGLLKPLEEAIDTTCFYQYLFFQQWSRIKNYANSKGIQVIGDIPIFVAYDSADIWANIDIFQASPKGKLKNVAGVPPDYFSELGQLWGNPLYDWNALKEDKYKWWMDRFKLNFELFDIIRLDHFRGFYDYWKIPADAPDARTGKWSKGPGMKFFETLKKQFPDAKVIAEDLGEEMDKVFTFRKKIGLPGMAILQFAFDGDPEENPYHPDRLEENCVVYPGTHDNDTSFGWYDNQASEDAKHNFRSYLSVDGNEVPYDLIRCAYRSPCKLAVVPLQDFMSLGSEARFNAPGTEQGNWQWRYSPEQLEAIRGATTDYLQQLAKETGRL